MQPRSFLVVGTTAGLVLGGLLLLGAMRDRALAAEPPQSQSLSPLEWNRSLMARGRVSEKLGQNEDALADYTLAIESHALPNDEQARALFDRGLLSDGMGRLDEALADYGASLNLSPQFAAALNNRGNVYRRLGRMADARRDYLAALEAGNPQSQYSYYGLGEIAAAEGGKTEAKEFYTKALAVDSHYDLARDRLAALASGEQMARLEPPPPTPVPASSPVSTPSLPASDDGDMAIPVTLHPPKSARRHAPVLQATADAPDPVLKPSLGAGRQASGLQVQLGAWRSEAEANQGWDHALRQAGETLKGLSPQIVTVELPKAGRYYRLRVAAGQDGVQGALCGSCGKRSGLPAGTRLIRLFRVCAVRQNT